MPLDRRFGNATWTGRWVRRLLGQLLRRVPRVRLFLRSREGSSYPGPRTSTSRSVRPAGCTRRGGAWPSYGPSRPGGGPAHAGAPDRPHAATGDARARSRSAPDRAHIALPGMYRAGHPAAAHLPPAWTPRSSAARASEGSSRGRPVAGGLPDRQGDVTKRAHRARDAARLATGAGAYIRCLWPARSESGVSPRLRPGGGALAFEQLQDALRVLPDRADVVKHQLGRSVFRHPLEQPPEI
jgi:hypothetical protein